MDGTTQARIVLTFVQARAGTAALQQTEWVHALSLELGWMSPGQARRFVDAAKAAGLLIGEPLGLAFAAVDVPRGFRPNPELLPSGPAPDDFVALLDQVAATAGQGRPDVLRQVEAVQASMGGLLDAETAVRWVARRLGATSNTVPESAQ